MAEEPRSAAISDIQELQHLAEEVRKTKKPRVIDLGGNVVAIIRPVSSSLSRRKTDADIDAFFSSAGGWKDEDTDALKGAIYESRRISTKPPVDL